MMIPPKLLLFIISLLVWFLNLKEYMETRSPPSFVPSAVPSVPPVTTIPSVLPVVPPSTTIPSPPPLTPIPTNVPMGSLSGIPSSIQTIQASKLPSLSDVVVPIMIPPVPTTPTSTGSTVLIRPYENVTTTPMDEFVENECFFGTNPHVIAQCLCYGTIDTVAIDTLQLYGTIKNDINQFLYGGGNKLQQEGSESCSMENQALVWISSGNTRDAGHFYQRYVLVLTFLQLNGTLWDTNDLWMSDVNECSWFGLQCNSNFEIESIILDSVNVRGRLPTEILYLTNLHTLSLTQNHLSGSIPTEYFALPYLQNLNMSSNQLIGSIPSEIGIATNLKRLGLESNLMFGTLVTEIGSATNLEHFTISYNEFWRSIPIEIGRLTKLQVLNIEDNRFSGSLPTEFVQLMNMEQLKISNNLLTGSIPTQYTTMSNLIEFKAQRSGLGGTIPIEITTAWFHLKRLEIGGNHFIGSILDELGLMTSLLYLGLNENDLTGSIPPQLGMLHNLTHLALHDNLLRGTIPTELGVMTRLQELTLEKNMLFGTAPEQICALRQNELQIFVTDCPSTTTNVGVICSIDDCCTFCHTSR
jgi:hypothetical protein